MAINKKFEPYIVVFSAALFFLFEYINMNSLDPLNSLLRQSFQVDAFQISNFSAMYFYANVLFLIPAGLLLDRLSTKRLLQIALICCICGNLVFASTHSFAVAKICRFVIGMGSTLVLLAPALLTARWILPNRAGLVMGIVVSFAMLGGSLAQQLPYLIDWLGSWRLVIVTIALLGVLFLGIISFFVKDYPTTFKPVRSHLSLFSRVNFYKNALQTIKSKQVWLGGFYASLINLTIMIIGALWGASYLETVHNLSAKHASFVVTMIFFGFLIGGPLFGLFSDRIAKRKWPMIMGGVLNLLCILVILKSDFAYPILAGLFFLLGVFSASQILVFPLIMESVPGNIIASSESLSAVLIMGGGALFQPVFGLLLNHFSQYTSAYTATAFKQAMWLLPITFLIATLLACFMKETHCKRLGE
jgi:MFS family permease